MERHIIMVIRDTTEDTERYASIAAKWSAAICNTSLLSRLLHRWEVGDGEGRMRKEIKRNGSRKDRSNCRRDPAKMSFVILTFNWEGILVLLPSIFESAAILEGVMREL